jgi:hypothetical protein
MFGRLAPVLVAGLLPVVVVGAEASGADGKTRLYGRVCTPEGKPAPGTIVDCLFFDPHQKGDTSWPVAWQLSDEEGRDGQVKVPDVGMKGETKARSDWWSRRLETKVVDLLKDSK